MTTAEAFAPAKINLTLHVTGQRADGYHLLDSLVVFADVGDRLQLRPGPGISLRVTGPFADGVPTDDRNLAWRALALAGGTGAVTLEKHLPHGAGIGSGSADAAAVLRLVQGDRAEDGGPSIKGAVSLGADVPVCLSSLPQRMRGIGEDLTHVSPVPPLALVLVNPGVPVSTPAVFRALTGKTNAPMQGLSGWTDRQAFVAWLAAQRNDLQPAAQALVPRVSAALDALADAELARMSGSGATCFGIYPDARAARAAADRIGAANPGWWVQATTTTGS